MTTAVRFEVRKASPLLWDDLATWRYAADDHDGPRACRKVIAVQPVAA
jgi:hypothetical protein